MGGSVSAVTGEFVCPTCRDTTGRLRREGCGCERYRCAAGCGAVDVLSGLGVNLWDTLCSEHRNVELRRLRADHRSLSTPAYRLYLESAAWKRVSAAVKGGRCESCERVATEAHHVTYERIGSESPGDVVGLCRTCHARRHGLNATSGVAGMRAGVDILARSLGSIGRPMSAHERKLFRKSRRWRSVRAEAIDRDGYSCQFREGGEVCGAVADGNSTWLEVHHILPLSRGGDPLDLGNLITLCNHCHYKMGAS